MAIVLEMARWLEDEEARMSYRKGQHGFHGSAEAPLLPLLGQHYKEVPLLNALISVTYTQPKGFWAHTYWTVSDRFRNSHIFTFHKCFSMRYSERIDSQEFVFTQEINRKLSCFPKTLRNHGICQSVRFVAGDCQLGGPHGTNYTSAFLL